MPRPRKQRTIEIVDQPQVRNTEAVILSLDEYEVIKHIDYEHLNQENCALHLNVSRTTVQRIYAAARQKLAVALIEKRPLEVKGGEVETIKVDACAQHRDMVIALAVEKDQIAQHFGKAPNLLVLHIVSGRIKHRQIVEMKDSIGHERPQALQQWNVNHILVHHMGKSMYNHFLTYGIQAIQAQSMEVEEAIRLFLEDPSTKRELNPCQLCT